MSNRSIPAALLGWLLLIWIGIARAELNLEATPIFPVGAGPREVALADVNGDGRPDAITANTDAGTVSVLLGKGDGRFGAAVDFPVGDAPVSAAVADLNGDGRLDLVAANLGGGTLSVLLGSGDGTFLAKMDYPAGDQPSSVTVADLNGDGKPDAVTANLHGHTVSVLLGNGDGTFRMPAEYAVDYEPSSVAVADVNGDGQPDVVTANLGSVSVLLGRGDGTLQARVDYRVGAWAVSVALADVSGDGKPDIVTANHWDGTVSVLLGQGDGGFRAAVDYPVGSGPGSVVLADLNGDGKPDVVTANETAHTVSVLLGQGDGTFAAKTDYVAGGRCRSAAVADVNGDGRPDAVTANGDNGSLSVLLGNGDGTFRTPVDYAVGSGPDAVAAADVNADGKTDVVTANHGGDTVSVLLGRGDGGFRARVDYATGGGPRSVALADLNGDGQPDAATANDSTSTLSVLLGAGDGTFRTKVDYPAGSAPYSVAPADVNGDGKMDLVAANSHGGNGGSVSVLLGRGDGTFREKADYVVGSGPQAVAVADVNGDGHPDVATANFAYIFISYHPVQFYEYHALSVLLGKGDGTFKAYVDYALDYRPGSVVLADVNGDGHPDAVTANGTVSVLLGNGDGTFRAPADYPTPGAGSVALADVNGDGKLDAATANGNSTASVLLGAGDGTFRERADYAVGGGPRSVALADLDGDAKPDLVTANDATNTAAVLRNLSTSDESPVSLGPVAPFGEQAVGTSSAPQAAVLANTGREAYEIRSITASGDFTLGHDCGTRLAAGGSCTVQVAFAPATAGNRGGSLAVTSDNPADPALARAWLRALSGIGVNPPSPTVSLGELAPFGSQLVGTSSAPQAVILSNTGREAYEIRSIAVSGDFILQHDCGTHLAADASCTVRVAFVPQAVGAREGSLTVAGHTGNPIVRGLSGTGIVAVTADIALKISAPKSVKQGRQVTYTFTAKNRSKRKAPEVVITGNPVPDVIYTKLPPYCGVSGQTLTCHLNRLAGKQQKVFTVKLRAGGPGVLVFAAGISGQVNDSNTANNTAEVFTRVK